MPTDAFVQTCVTTMLQLLASDVRTCPPGRTYAQIMDAADVSIRGWRLVSPAAAAPLPRCPAAASSDHALPRPRR